MKRFKLVSLIFLSLFAFTISSCDDEPLEVDFPTGGGGGGSDTTCTDATNDVADATVAFGTVTPADDNYTSVCNDYLTALQNFINACGDPTGDVQAVIDGLDCTGTGGPGPADYWPRAIGNTWNYNIADGTSETYVINGTEMIDGSEFYVFNELFGVPSWLRKEGNDYFVRAQFAGEIMGIGFTSTPYTVTMIKDDAPVGDIWKSEVSYTISYDPGSGIPDSNVEAVYTFEMIERDITRTVEGEDYEEVIHIELEVASGGQSVVVDYYYANQIGLIEYVTEEGSNTLRSYLLN